MHRGPLHYAFDISRNQTVLAQNSQQPLAVDLQYLPTEAWQYAIDTSSLTFNSNPPSSGELPSPIFDYGLPPLTITATACDIEWNLAGSNFVTSPPTNPNCTGAATSITLWPYGVSEQFAPRWQDVDRRIAGYQASHRRVPDIYAELNAVIEGDGNERFKGFIMSVCS